MFDMNRREMLRRMMESGGFANGIPRSDAMAPAWSLPLLSMITAAAGLAAGSTSTGETLASSLSIPNTTVVSVPHHEHNPTIPLSGTIASCNNNATVVPTSLRRVVLDTASSGSSSVHIEAWLPDSRNEWLITTAGGGLGGCRDYATMRVSAPLDFASFGMNGGHNGSSYDAFLRKSEVIRDVGERAMHVQVEVAKEVVKQYYAHKTAYSYYVGCSTGVRQGLSSETLYPHNFDGMLVGAPGVEWVCIVGHWYTQAQRYGWPDVTSPRYVDLAQFRVINEKGVELFDAADGAENGYIDDSSRLRIKPQIFACGTGLLNTSGCLRNAQHVESVRLAYGLQVDGEGNIVSPLWNGVPTQRLDRNARNGSEVPR
jgi:hypothetical protein